MNAKIRCVFFIALVLAIGLSACSTIPIQIDTGANLQKLVNGALADLQEAERIGGDEARATIDEAITQLKKYSAYITQVFGNELDKTISTLDQSIQNKLYWIETYTDQVHNYALEIINATGTEARETITTATNGIRASIADTDEAMQRVTWVIAKNTIAVIDETANTVIVVVVVIAVVTLAIVTAILLKSKKTVAAVVTAVAAIGLCALFIPTVRVNVLNSLGKANFYAATEPEVFVPPQVTGFEPDTLVVPIPAPTPETFVIMGNHLTAYGMPIVKYGNYNLDIPGYYDDKITVNVSGMCDHGCLTNTIQLQFGSGNTVITRALPVQTAVPTPPSVMVPDVRGLTPDQAETAIRNAKLQADRKPDEFSSDVNKGLVIRTNPEVGMPVPPGTVVEFYVSNGPETEPVPRDVIGQSQDVATQILADHGFTVGSVSEEYSDTQIGQVSDTEPSVDTNYRKGSSVNLWISKGPLPATETPTLPPPPPLPLPTTYEITVKTGCVDAAGTDAHVHIILYGTNSNSPETNLNTPDHDDFVRCNTDTYRITTDDDLGDLQMINIKHDQTGDAPGWFLDSISIKNINTNQSWYFPCGRWLAVNKDDRQISRNVYPNGPCQ